MFPTETNQGKEDFWSVIAAKHVIFNFT